MMRLRNISSLFLIAFLPLVSLAGHPHAMPMRASLDGKWAITIIPDEDARHSGERDMKDTITFKGGKFTSEAFEKRGFPAAVYEDEMHPGGAGGFSVLQMNKSADEGTANWSGFVSNPEMTGDIVVKKKDGTVLNFSFKGSKE